MNKRYSEAGLIADLNIKIASLKAQLSQPKGVVSTSEIRAIANWANNHDVSFNATIELEEILKGFRPMETDS